MARLNEDNVTRALRIIAQYPRARSAIIPLCHVAQEQDGYLTEEAMVHIGELVGAQPAEIRGVASFYEMFKLHPVGKYLIGVCTNLSCMLRGADELLTHCALTLGIEPGETTSDGLFTLEETECLAACTQAPAMQVNYRYFGDVSQEDFDQLVADIRQGVKEGHIPPHGTISRVRREVEEARLYGVLSPEASAKDRSRAATRGAPE